jgi:hypothetical protein
MAMTKHEQIEQIHHSYRPYDTMPEYWAGFVAYNSGIYRDYPAGFTGVQMQAWDRGQNAAMRVRQL